MDSIIQFGHNAFGLAVAYLVAAIVIGIVLGLFVSAMEYLQGWVNKNGWDD
jgi:uncharacterized protein YneF (UPF0154 family)